MRAVLGVVRVLFAAEPNESDVSHEMRVAQRLVQDGAADDECEDARELRLFEASAAATNDDHDYYYNDDDHHHNDDH